MRSKFEIKKEMYGATVFFFINGILFGITWERLGTNHAWSYANLDPMIAEIPIVVCIGWGTYSLFTMLLLTKSTKMLVYCLSPFILSLFIEPYAIRLGFWNYIFLNGELYALLPYFIMGYLLITISFTIVNNMGWKYVLKQKNSVKKVFVMLSCMLLCTINGLFVYAALSILYFKEIPTWLFSRLLF